MSGTGTPWMNIARVVKTQGLKGEVVVVPTDDLPFIVSPGLHVTLTPPQLEGVRDATVASVRELANGWGVTFEEVAGIDEASRLVGRLLLARRDELDCDFGSVEFAAFSRRAVNDASLGFVGNIVDVLEGPEYDTWVVEGPYGEFLLPAVAEHVLDVPDDEDAAIRVDLPEGLVDLAVKEGGDA